MSNFALLAAEFPDVFDSVKRRKEKGGPLARSAPYLSRLKGVCVDAQ